MEFSSLSFSVKKKIINIAKGKFGKHKIQNRRRWIESNIIYELKDIIKEYDVLIEDDYYLITSILNESKNISERTTNRYLSLENIKKIYSLEKFISENFTEIKNSNSLYVYNLE